MTLLKDPDAVLDYEVNWATWLGTDTIATSEWLTAEGISEADATNTATATTIWLSGGDVGQVYDVVNRITTVGGRTNDQTIRVRIMNR